MVAPGVTPIMSPPMALALRITDEANRSSTCAAAQHHAPRRRGVADKPLAVTT